MGEDAVVCEACGADIDVGAKACSTCGAIAGAELRPGQLIAGRFQLQRLVARGGVGEVWLARDTQLDGAEVACKFLKPELRRNRLAVADLKREVLLTRKLRHPNILPVYTFWESEDLRFITMEYVAGRSLAAELNEREVPFTLPEVLSWAGELCQALDYAHQMGILHRDVKPSNILLHDGRAQLADFGIARAIIDVEHERGGGLTQGTVAYMSPEHLMGETLAGYSDQYSFGVTLYEMLSKEVPFWGEDVVADAQLKPAPKIAHLSNAVNDTLQRALAKDPEDRFRNCAEFFVALSTADPGVSAPPRPRAARAAREKARETRVLQRPDIETRRSRLGRLLLESRMIGQENLADALIRQQKKGGKLGSILVEMGFMSEEQLIDSLAKQLGVAAIELDTESFDLSVSRRLSYRHALELFMLPVRRSKGAVLVAMADPLDTVALNHLEQIFDDAIAPRIASSREILAHIERVFASAR